MTCLQTLLIPGIFCCFLSFSNLCFFCQVFASCHDDAAPASGSDAHCISARSWICAYSRYVFSPWRLWNFQMKGFAEINIKLLLFLQNIKEAINDFSLTTFPMIYFYEKREQIKCRSVFSLVPWSYMSLIKWIKMSIKLWRLLFLSIYFRLWSGHWMAV